jgi:SpoVK/Ycf46/Vps4 family AAA+-type ATPase
MALMDTVELTSPTCAGMSVLWAYEEPSLEGPSKILKRWQQVMSVLLLLTREEEMDLPLTNDDFRAALSKVQPSVGKEDLEQYKRWMAEYGSA